MARSAESEIERLKLQVSVVRLVEAAGIALKPHGKDLVGRCPFHDDKTPSLVVSHPVGKGLLKALSEQVGFKVNAVHQPREQRRAEVGIIGPGCPRERVLQLGRAPGSFRCAIEPGGDGGRHRLHLGGGWLRPHGIRVHAQGTIVMPGVFLRSTMIIEMPLCLGASWSVRTASQP